MSKTGMWVVILVIALLAVGAWWYSTHTPVAQPAVTTTQEPPPPPPPTPTPPPPPPTGISQDSSNAGLDADLKTVDGQIKDADSENAAAASFSDTPVQQTE